MHDKCDIKELDPSMKCGLNVNVLECAATPCGEQKKACDCNVYHKWLGILTQIGGSSCYSELAL